MKILILEDEAHKAAEITQAIKDVRPDCNVTIVENCHALNARVYSESFDLLILDLYVPRSPAMPDVHDQSGPIVEAIRDPGSKCLMTPAIVITKHLGQTDEYYAKLNAANITATHYDGQGRWKADLQFKMAGLLKLEKFPYVIICALHKEADAFQGLADQLGPVETINDISCRRITIGGQKGVVVIPPRMGLVASGIIAAYAIERFCPQLICMSGICGGVAKESEIYEVLVTDSCHQHDSGKWTDQGFKSEHYDYGLEIGMRNLLEQLIFDKKFLDKFSSHKPANALEYRKDTGKYDAKIKLSSTSSGSAVIAATTTVASLPVGQRKLAGFDMEIYAVYAAAKMNAAPIRFFAAKSVVDDGDANKGDNFHRLGAILSAQFVVSAIETGAVSV